MFLNYDLRYSLRTLRRTPGFALAAIAILALTIGANTAIFSVVHAIVLRPLPYLHPDELVELAERNAAGERVSVAYPNFENWRDETQGLVHMAAFVGASYNVSNVEGTPEPILGMRVGPEFLGILGIVPAMGRDFVVQDGRGDGEHVMLLTDSLWRRRFGADPQVVGKPVTMGFIPYTVVGVLPASFRFLPDTEVLVPLGTNNGDRGSHGGMSVVGRLGPGVMIARARTQLQTIALRLATAFPASNSGLSVSVLPLHDSWAGGRRTLAVVLFIAVLLVLFIWCANLANLFLTRGLARDRETLTRTALGASRWQLMRQSLTESLLLAFLGASVGVGVAYLTLPALAPLVPAPLQSVAAVGINRTVLGVTALMA